MEVEVPVGAEAVVYVPAGSVEAVTERGKPVVQAEAVQFVKAEGGAAIFRTGSGTYHFETRQ
jgi:hypothetical protein